VLYSAIYTIFISTPSIITYLMLISAIFYNLPFLRVGNDREKRERSETRAKYPFVIVCGLFTGIYSRDFVLLRTAKVVAALALRL
jgi:hypothetical protein